MVSNITNVTWIKLDNARAIAFNYKTAVDIIIMYLMR